jgi:hypothetical protein
MDLIETDAQEVTDITTADSLISPRHDPSPTKKTSGGKIVKPPQEIIAKAKTKEPSRKSMKEPMTMDDFRNLIQKKPSRPKSNGIKVKQPILRNIRSNSVEQKPIQPFRSPIRQDHDQKPSILKEPMSFKLSPKETSISHVTSPIKDNKSPKIVMGQNHFEKTTESYRNRLNSKLDDLLPGKEIHKRFNNPLSPFRNDASKIPIFGGENLLLNKKSEALHFKESRNLSIEEGGVCFKAKPIMKEDQFPCRSVRSPRLTEPHSPKFNTSRKSLMKSILKENESHFQKNRTI